jgi:hypothetical protein
MPRAGFDWTGLAGGDAGYIGSDAFLDGGFSRNGPSVERRNIVVRARVGVLLDYENLGFGFSLNWLGQEFHGQGEGQVIGAFQIKYRL